MSSFILLRQKQQTLPKQRFLKSAGKLIGFKSFATLLPKNWLAETPQPLAVRRLGRQSAERERISEIN
ncbi:hypothetical protein [Peribacillus aracenensis]|uniref:hypothetical protein n=1 Tax=Peribacillus aracenensis TaxID=2976708 RepID=UPI0021A66131|nr:hypothetical protein [Peribacillus sp. BBB004]